MGKEQRQQWVECSFILSDKDAVAILRLKLTWIVINVFYLPTDEQVNCLKDYFKIYIKIDIKTASTCFGAITIIRERIIRAC
jgi:hypothetical protein